MTPFTQLLAAGVAILGGAAGLAVAGVLTVTVKRPARPRPPALPLSPSGSPPPAVSEERT